VILTQLPQALNAKPFCIFAKLGWMLLSNSGVLTCR
jgi:hypothetical protein